MIVAVKRRLEQIRQRWWVVLLVAVPAVAVAVSSSLLAYPTYTGKSTLVVSSPGRATDQDAFMAVGYATLFNDPATQVRLRASKSIPQNVTFEARTEAASPILTFEATADNPQVAQSAAQTMAGAFRDDINAMQQKKNQELIADLQRQLNDLWNYPEPDGSANPAVGPVADRIAGIRFDSTNQLQDLQPQAGVVETTPKVMQNLVIGTAGALLLGILAALGLAAVSTRLTTSADLRDKTGVEPLVELPTGGSVDRDRVREDRLRTLMNFVTLEDLPKSPVLALTDSRGVHAARDLAKELATLSAKQGYRTVLVYADNDASGQTRIAGFNDALADSTIVSFLLQDTDLETLKFLPYGKTPTDGYLRLTRDRVEAILDELRTSADTIIIAAPSTADITEAQLVCSAADLTLLVVSRRLSRATDVTSVAEALSKAHATLLGAVLIDKTNGRQARLPHTANTRAPINDGAHTSVDQRDARTDAYTGHEPKDGLAPQSTPPPDRRQF